jgi:ribosomal protein S18 acetylase RimI-like enzyme
LPALESIDIRKANKGDLEEIVRLWMAMMDEHMRFDPRLRLSPDAREGYAAYISRHLRRPESVCLVIDAVNGGVPRLAAYCLAYIAENLPMFEPDSFGFISDLAVDEPWRRQGLGARLVERVKDWMRHRGIGVVQLQVYANNDKGRAFWDRQGFANFFERKWLDL